jgi:peptidoglycan/xylan/chitin deacetylase (PgdA/CDA1 family)
MKYTALMQRIIHHPLIIVPLLVIVLAFVWRQYELNTSNLNLPTSNLNLLTADTIQSSPDNTLVGWQLAHSGTATYALSHTNGIITNRATKVTIGDYQNGDVTLAGPKVSVKPDQTYLFKGYYTSDIPFTLLARYYYTDGTNTLIHLDAYPTHSDGWSTASYAFDTTNHVAAIQFIYKMSAKGAVTFDGTYLEPKQNVFIPDQPKMANNSIPNPTFAITDTDVPNEWSTYSTGDNTTAFSFLHDSNGAYIKTAVTGFKTGEAKWQYTPQSVTPHQRYQFSAAYMSDVPTKLVAEYVLVNGKHQFEVISDIPPADTWTDITYPLEIPSSANSLVVSMVLSRNGSIASRNYTLANISKPGNLEWKRPIVSLTFDDGWRSAYNNALPILDRYGYKSTFYINPSSVETPGFMSAAELAKLYGDQHEIAAHGYSHMDMTMLSPDALDKQLSQGQSALSDAGVPVSHVATPYGKSDAEVQWYARRYFTTIRSVDTGINTKQNLDPYNLKTLFIRSDTSKDAIAAALNEAKQAGAWLIFVYHNIGPTPSKDIIPNVENANISATAFADQMALIQKSGMVVLPVGNAYKEVSVQ